MSLNFRVLYGDASFVLKLATSILINLLPRITYNTVGLPPQYDYHYVNRFITFECWILFNAPIFILEFYMGMHHLF